MMVRPANNITLIEKVLSVLLLHVREHLSWLYLRSRKLGIKLFPSVLRPLKEP
jgi:hypothetical protein